MAMLAEPRRKQKWTLNPRGKQWSEDSNKFGQKMLEKMGWTSGKGLGANEQGMTEHVKVSYKNNQSGIGFKDRGDQWTRHQEDFNHFLSQLQEQNSNSEGSEDTKTNNNTEETEGSLELKSKQSRARVHYHKFTRGKDVKKYSAKDLANIFGKKDLKDSAKVSEALDTAEEITADPKGSRDNRGGVLTIKGGNIDEYFKKKSSSFVRNGDSNHADASEDEYEPRLGFGFDSASGKDSEPNKNNSGFAFANEGLDLEYPEKTSGSLRCNAGFAYNNPCLSADKRKDLLENSTVPFCSEGFVNPALNLNGSTTDGNNGAEFEVSRVEFGLDNNALDLSDEDGRKKRVTFNETVEYSTDVVKKKKKRKGKDKLDKFEVDNSKLKKLKETTKGIELSVSGGIEAEGFVNEALEIEAINDEVNDNEVNERKTKKSKRKKNRRTLSLETIEETAEEISQIDESEIGEAVLLDEEVSPKKNKKLKKNSEIERNLESNTEVLEVEVEASGAKKKDKKERKVIVLEEPTPEKKSSKKKEKSRKSEDVEITVLAEISRKIGKGKKNRVGNEPESCDQQEAAIKSTATKKKDKKRSKLKDEGKDIIEIMFPEANGDSDIEKNGTAAGTKRKSNSGEESGLKSGKRTKLDSRLGTEDEENVEQNQEVRADPAPLTLQDKKNKRSRKSFKSLFVKAPTLYFSGSNINEMAGYGATVTEIKFNN